MGILRTDTISGLETPTPVTGSVSFDGSGDYLSLASSNDFAYGTYDFTWEGWFYVENFDSGKYILDHGTNVGIIEIFSSSGKMIYYNATTGAGSSLYTTGFGTISINTWHHFAAVRNGGTTFLYLNGNLSTSASDGHNYNGSTSLNIGRYGGDSNYFSGYISNLRLLKGTALYTSNFTPPTRELQPIGDTVLLCCNNPDSAGAEATGKTITVNGDAVASTFSPGLTRDFTYGTQFDGVSRFDTQGYFVPPSGTTEQRGRGRGLFGGGYISSGLNTIEYVTISSTGNAQDFGDLTDGRYKVSSLASSTRGLFAGGWDGLPNFNIIDYVTIATTSNAVDFGDLTAEKRNSSGLSNSTRGIIAGGETPAATNVIDYVTIASLGDAATFGELITSGQSLSGGVSSPTRGVFGGGSPGITTLQYITIATTGNAQNFGDLTVSKQVGNACSSATRGIFGGAQDNTIDYITISSLGNAQDFGDMFVDRALYGATSNSIKGIFGGGRKTPTNYNTIDFVTIATTGNAQDFGDLTQVKYYVDATSDSHGGLS
jgi:hypothetical protein